MKYCSFQWNCVLLTLCSITLLSVWILTNFESFVQQTSDLPPQLPYFCLPDPDPDPDPGRSLPPPSLFVPEISPVLDVALSRAERDRSIQPGGFHTPRVCGGRAPRTRVAILVPYRDREENLKRFLAYMHPFLQGQNLEYKIYVISQKVDDQLFNRGTLLNIGYVFAQKDQEWDCLMLHDVDLLPENPDYIYECWDQPRHMNAASSNFDYVLPSGRYFGGVTAMTPKQFSDVNGFSNLFFGWGCEDDDLFHRVIKAKYRVERSLPEIGRYTSLSHEKQTRNRQRFYELFRGLARMDTEGLNSLSFKLLSIERNKLFTNVTVEVESASHKIETGTEKHPSWDESR